MSKASGLERAFKFKVAYEGHCGQSIRVMWKLIRDEGRGPGRPE